MIKFIIVSLGVVKEVPIKVYLFYLESKGSPNLMAARKAVDHIRTVHPYERPP